MSFPWLLGEHEEAGGPKIRARGRSNDSSAIQGVLGQPPPCLSTVTASLLPVTASSVRFCFVGCGSIASHHLKALPPSALVTAVVDPSEEARERVAREIALRGGGGGGGGGSVPAPTCFASLGAALEADPRAELFNAVDIMVPNVHDLHAELCVMALDAARHVLLEKPIAAKLSAAKRIQARYNAAAAAHGAVLMVAENAQFWPEVVETLRVINAGRVGEVLSVHAKCWESAAGAWADDYKAGTWRTERSALPGGSYVFDSVSHWIRPLRMWLGEVVAVSATLGRSLPHMAGPSIAAALLRCRRKRGGATVTATLEVMLSPACVRAASSPFFRVTGARGEIVIDASFDGGATLWTVASSDGLDAETQVADGGGMGPAMHRQVLCREGWDASYAGEMRAFCDAVSTGASLAQSVRDAIQDLRVIEAIHEAAERGCWVELEHEHEHENENVKVEQRAVTGDR